MISRIIKVSVRVISLSLWLRLITPTLIMTLIILDIKKPHPRIVYCIVLSVINETVQRMVISSSKPLSSFLMTVRLLSEVWSSDLVMINNCSDHYQWLLVFINILINAFIFFQADKVMNPTIWLVLSAVRIFPSLIMVKVMLAWVFFREFFFIWELGKKLISYLPA